MKILIIIINLFVFTSMVNAADVWQWTDKNNRVKIVLEGEIVKGDYKKIYNYAKAKGPDRFDLLYLRSPGGDFIEAIKIGELLRALKVGVSIPSIGASGPVCYDNTTFPVEIGTPLKNDENCTCLSACAMIYIGSPYRLGSYLGLHRPYYNAKYYSSLEPDEAVKEYDHLKKVTSTYLKKMGVSDNLYDIIMASASDEITFLDGDYITKNLAKYIPEYDEWVKAKCPGLPPQEQAIFDNLSKKIRGDNRLTKIEQDTFFMITGKIVEIEGCRWDAFGSARKASFEKFFNVKY